MSQKLKYLGVPVFMNGQNYYIPSLSTRDFRNNYDLLTAKPAEGEAQTLIFDKFVPIILLAINRNYSDVTLSQLEEWLDIHTFKLAMKAVQDSTGLTPVAEGE